MLSAITRGLVDPGQPLFNSPALSRREQHASAVRHRAHPAAIRWPDAPFSSGFRSKIYVNQWGIATLPAETLNSFNGYDLWFDDGGPLKVTTTGPVGTDLAYYVEDGPPVATASAPASSNSTSLNAQVSTQRLLEHIGVRPAVAGSSGTFTLDIAGPPEGANYPVHISRTTLTGSSRSGITGTYDYDIYRFRLPRGGNWQFEVRPTTSSLDVSMNVYDYQGNPVAGSFTSAINRRGPGRAEVWTGRGLKSGEEYFIRVDGVNGSMGRYVVSVTLPSASAQPARPTDSHRAAPADATVNPWPTSPFYSRRASRSIPYVFVNQFGYAVLRNQTFGGAGSVNGYNFSFDDGGSLKLITSGYSPTDLAYYDYPGNPSAIDAQGNASSTVQASIANDKRMHWIAVRPHNGVTGAYALQIVGVPFYALDTIAISKSKNAGSSGADINGDPDYDFFKFTVPRNGNWLIQVFPDNQAHSGEDTHLWPLMNVYDAKGNPIAGTFTSELVSRGPGLPVSWTAIGLKAGSTYYVRVDGYQGSTGGYGVSVQIAPNIPDVSLAATVPYARPGRRGSPGELTITRSDTGGGALTVGYTVAGTAVAGKDYLPLSGVITLPAGIASATLQIPALRSATAGRKLVVLLSSSPKYNLTAQDQATITVS